VIHYLVNLADSVNMDIETAVEKYGRLALYGELDTDRDRLYSEDMIETTTQEDNMNTRDLLTRDPGFDPLRAALSDSAQGAWDSESRQSPYSTVADPSDEGCEVCYADECECVDLDAAKRKPEWERTRAEVEAVREDALLRLRAFNAKRTEADESSDPTMADNVHRSR
jgi:hypothetical protein